MSGTALHGIKVLEYSEMVAGPYCGKLFADLGADVIKMEPPDGDPTRAFGPFPPGRRHREKSALYLYNNTSKRGITIDLSTEPGKEIFRRLVQWADVLIDNHPVGFTAGLGFDDAALLKLNPRLIYTCITPYGHTGPRAGVKGDELTVSHAGGLGNLLPSRSRDIKRAPVKPGGFHVAYHSAIVAAMVALAAVIGRGKEGKGRIIDISMQEVVVGSIRPNVTGSRYQRSYWGRVPDRPPAMGRMQTSDGYLVLGAAEDHHFAALREVIGNPPWLADDRWLNMWWRTNHAPEIAPMLDAWMSKQQKEDIHQKLSKRGVPLGPVNSVKEVMENEQYTSRDYFKNVDDPRTGTLRYPGWPYLMTGSPPRISHPAPSLGQHNEEVCMELGYSEQDYRRLKKSGAFGKAKR